MIKLQKAERAALQGLIQSDVWDIVIRLIDDQFVTLGREPIVGQNEFETLRSLFHKEGRLDGMGEFINIIEREANK